MTLLELPDWTQAVQLIGNYGGTPVLISVDAAGQLYALLKGHDGTQYVPLRVDANGNIIAIMKGEHAGVLKSVAVDAAGRMIMIPTDPADIWGNAISMGNAELSAVFSFAKQYDRRGQVIFVEGFESGLRGWEKYTSGTGAAIDFSSAQAKSGAFSCELVAGKTAERYAHLQRHFGFPIEGNMGFEFSFTLEPETSDVQGILAYYDGTNTYTFVVNYSKANKRLSCGGFDGGHTTLKTNLDLYTQDSQFHTIKVVGDFLNKKFVRVMCDGLGYTPTGAAVGTGADTSSPRVLTVIRHTGVVAPALNPNIWVDNIILTQMEPE